MMSRLVNETERKLTAIHEAAHAIVGLLNGARKVILSMDGAQGDSSAGSRQNRELEGAAGSASLLLPAEFDKLKEAEIYFAGGCAVFLWQYPCADIDSAAECVYNSYGRSYALSRGDWAGVNRLRLSKNQQRRALRNSLIKIKSNWSAVLRLAQMLKETSRGPASVGRFDSCA